MALNLASRPAADTCFSMYRLQMMDRYGRIINARPDLDDFIENDMYEELYRVAIEDNLDLVKGNHWVLTVKSDEKTTFSLKY